MRKQRLKIPSTGQGNDVYCSSSNISDYIKIWLIILIPFFSTNSTFAKFPESKFEININPAHSISMVIWWI